MVLAFSEIERDDLLVGANLAGRLGRVDLLLVEPQLDVLIAAQGNPQRRGLFRGDGAMDVYRGAFAL